MKKSRTAPVEKEPASGVGNRSASSKRWLKEHFADPYVQRAWKEGYRSRAAFKLIEILEKYPLLRPGYAVADLGAAPGGWSQVVARKLGGQGRVVAVDLLEMDVLAGVTVLQGDFLEAAIVQQVREHLGADGADLVLSDMAPNMTGYKVADQARGSLVAEAALTFAMDNLKPGGAFVLKLFQGPDFHTISKEAHRLFTTVRVVKPAASRDRSAENYLVAMGFKPERRPSALEPMDEMNGQTVNR